VTAVTRRRFLGTAATAGAALALGHRSPAWAQDKTKVTWSTWGSPEELARFNEFNADYMAKNPNIFREHYHPLSGVAPARAAPMFGWEAAAFLDLGVDVAGDSRR
jgi:hypothetical protein